MKQQYTAVYKRDGKWWVVTVEGLPGAISQGRTLNEARENIKDAISIISEVSHGLTGVDVSSRDVLREEMIVTGVKSKAAARMRQSAQRALVRAAQ